MNLEALRRFEIPARDHDYDERDVILYALALGYGTDPLDEEQLKFVYEDGLKMVPSMCNTIAHPGFWIKQPDLDIDWVRVLHGEQSFKMHTPMPAKARVRGTYNIAAIEDKGVERGAVMRLEKLLHDRDTGALYYSVNQTIFMRGDGGQGGFGEAASATVPMPETPPELVIETKVLPQAALIYRLCGDMNPIHASPEIARKAGFDRPILHGLCTMGIATRALLEAVCNLQPERLRSMFVRFSKPAYPGETIHTEIYKSDGRIRFRCRALERNVVVLDRGDAHVQ
jgi:acyl dehydratase